MSACHNIFATRARWFGRQGRWTGCTPPTAAERMAIHSERRAAEIAQREALSVAPPRIRLVDGRPALLALPGAVNPLPKPRAGTEQEQP